MTLTADSIHDIFEYNPITGDFIWRNPSGRKFKSGDKAGYVHKDGYGRIGYKRKEYQSHRLAWLYIYGDWPSKDLDHIDGNPSNNSISNLREVTKSQNSENRRRANKNSKTGVLGVSLHSQTNKYRAAIRYSGKCKSLGLFDTVEEAHNAYLIAKEKFHPFSTLGAK